MKSKKHDIYAFRISKEDKQYLKQLIEKLQEQTDLPVCVIVIESVKRYKQKRRF